MKNLVSKDVETYDIGASLGSKRELVTEATFNREVNVHCGPMKGKYSTSFNAENNFVLNSHSLSELRKEIKIPIKSHKLEESTDKDVLEYSLKEQEKSDRAEPKILQGKDYLEFLANIQKNITYGKSSSNRLHMKPHTNT